MTNSLISRAEHSAVIQPFLDLFGLGLTTKDVVSYGYTQGGAGARADQIHVTVYAKDEHGESVGTTTHSRRFEVGAVQQRHLDREAALTRLVEEAGK